MSSQAEAVAQPAGRGRGCGSVVVWKVVAEVEGERFISSRSCRSAKLMLPPAESPAKTMLEGETGVWKEPGGG